MDSGNFIAIAVIVIFVVPLPFLIFKIHRIRQSWPGIPCVHVQRIKVGRFTLVLLAISTAYVGWVNLVILVGNFLHIPAYAQVTVFLSSLLNGFMFGYFYSMKKIRQNTNVWICKTDPDYLEILEGQQIHRIKPLPGSVTVARTQYGPGGIMAFDYFVHTESIRFCFALPWSYYWNLDIQYTETAKHSEGLLVKGTKKQLIGLHRNLQIFAVV
ncbi:MAG: hypothetical protein JNJ69_02545 [Leptospiraceae bacterium]|nr:hypothetical protein [Leptospiraceae bacterium]